MLHVVVSDRLQERLEGGGNGKVIGRVLGMVDQARSGCSHLVGAQVSGAVGFDGCGNAGLFENFLRLVFLDESAKVMDSSKDFERNRSQWRF